MIFEWLFDAGLMFIDAILTLLDVLPSMPDKAVTAINVFFDFLFNGVCLISLLVDMDILLMLIPIVVAIVNLEDLYYLIIFVLKKIPFISIK